MRVRLALPFALVGAAAGWLSAAFLRNPFIGVIEAGHESLAAGVAAVVGALIGFVITRRRARGLEPGRGTWIPLTGSVLVGGAFTGAIVAFADVQDPVGVFSGIVNGMLAGVGFLPVCALVLGAARRAERARLGSVVAGSDRRAVWGILLTALAASAVVAALDWPFVGRPHYFEQIETPGVGVGVLALAELAVIGILIADARALRMVERASRLETRDSGERLDEGAAHRTDLGLGDGVAVALAPAGAAAYRTRERAAALVRGNAAEARGALHSALFRGGVGLAVIAAAAGTHVAVLCHATDIYSGDSAMVWSLGRAIAKHHF